MARRIVNRKHIIEISLTGLKPPEHDKYVVNEDIWGTTKELLEATIAITKSCKEEYDRKPMP
jgi:hypothetical protein